MKLKLHLLYALHMVLPLSASLWHLKRLSPDTLIGIAALFGRG
jgi:hypothetical protein